MMTKSDIPAVPDPEEEPEAYEDADELECLHIRRGWTKQQIADHFGVEKAEICRVLEENEISAGEGAHPPNRGLAAELWDRGRQERMQQ